MDPMKIISNVTGLLVVCVLLIAGLIGVIAMTNEPETEVKDDGPELRTVATEVSERLTDHPGYQLFSEWGCENCHRVNRKLIGPALSGVTQRREKEWIYQFVQNSTRMIENGEPTAVALYEEYNQYQMQSHDLSHEQIDQILAYVEEVSNWVNGGIFGW